MCISDIRWKQTFYEDAAPIKLREPLGELLGALPEGEELVFTYADAVKFAGHSCPAVSGAYKITQKALEALYGRDIPIRGEIKVKVLGSVEHGVNGPISQVITFITGAAPETGFAGLGGKFVRKNKLIFDEKNEEANTFIFTREDTNKSVKITYHPARLPQNDEMSNLFTKCIVQTASKEQKEKFQELWQERVRAVLFEEVSGLFSVKHLK